MFKLEDYELFKTEDPNELIDLFLSRVFMPNLDIILSKYEDDKIFAVLSGDFARFAHSHGSGFGMRYDGSLGENPPPPEAIVATASKMSRGSFLDGVISKIYELNNESYEEYKEMIESQTIDRVPLFCLTSRGIAACEMRSVPRSEARSGN